MSVGNGQSNTNQTGPSTVRLRFDDPVASGVSVAGSFSHWVPIPLKKNGEHWTLDLPLAPGHYEYQFIVDDQWTPDPAAEHSVLNPFGGRNSILVVNSVRSGAS